MKKLLIAAIVLGAACVSFAQGKELLQEAFEAFASETGISYGVVTPEGRVYQKGQSVVDADVASAQFVKSRSMAYERAYQSAVSQFMLDCYGRETTKRVSEFYGNQSSDAEEAPVAEAKGLLAKIGLLVEEKLNKALAAEGVPPEKYATATVVEKRKLLHDAILIETAARALHASSGCIPVKTFETRGEDGRYYIGVIVRYDATSVTLAEAFRKKQRPALKKEGGLTLDEVLPSKEAMLDNFGVRLYFDETGTPALLSFAQLGSSYTGTSARMKDSAEGQALNQARKLADSGLTSFISSIMQVNETSRVGEEITESRVFTDDGNVTPEEASKVIDVYRRSIEQVGGDTLLGRDTVFEGILTHPSGHKIAVAVRRWSFATVDATKAIDAPKKKEAEANKAPAVQREGAGVRSGATFDF